MIETLIIAIVFVVTEIFKRIITAIEKKTSTQLTPDMKDYVVLTFAFLLSVLYVALIEIQVINQETINTAVKIFAQAIAVYEVLYKRILVKIIEKVNTR